ncbi:Hypothetical protein I596_2596 [Dokdonella koreensis DS-123]|uniref:Uncharacterized protein n=1 Tax=Dokdonella koreensis DS-123 TaxID=1300342 RepID=A0A160DVL2_9GAMM|nr:Hypothetical protein I596_2596 [Dokdonella koreensis DS-123]
MIVDQDYANHGLPLYQRVQFRPLLSGRQPCNNERIITKTRLVTKRTLFYERVDCRAPAGANQMNRTACPVD